MLYVADDGTFSSPTTWVNFGALGLIVLAMLTGYLWAKPSVDSMLRDREHEREAAKAREDRLIAERDRALAERDEMVEVIKDFTHTATAIIPILQAGTQWRPPTRKRSE